MTAGFFYRIKEFLQRICRVSFFGVAIILCGQTSTLLLVLHEHPWLLLWFSSPELAVQSSPRNCFAFSLIFFVLHHFVGVMMKLTKHFQACLSIVTSDSDCVWHPWNFCGDVFFAYAIQCGWSMADHFEHSWCRCVRRKIQAPVSLINMSISNGISLKPENVM